MSAFVTGNLNWPKVSKMKCDRGHDFGHLQGMGHVSERLDYFRDSGFKKVQVFSRSFKLSLKFKNAQSFDWRRGPHFVRFSSFTVWPRKQINCRLASNLLCRRLCLLTEMRLLPKKTSSLSGGFGDYLWRKETRFSDILYALVLFFPQSQSDRHFVL